jgi:hypothetical protein
VAWIFHFKIFGAKIIWVFGYSQMAPGSWQYSIQKINKFVSTPLALKRKAKRRALSAFQRKEGSF